MRVRIVSWNIQWGRGADGRIDLRRVASWMRASGADVFCLQEVAVNHPGLPGGGAADQVRWLAEAFPDYVPLYAAASDLPDGAGGRRLFGNTILSRLPVLQVFRHALPWPVDPGVPSMPRVALEAVIDVSGGPMRVMTTHLEYYSVRQRRAQIEALRALHAEGWSHALWPRSVAEVDPPFAVLPRGECTVICGDFNCLPDAPELGLIAVVGSRETSEPNVPPRLLDAWKVLHPDFPNPPTAGLHGAAWPERPGCFDYFFVSDNLVPNIGRVAVDRDVDASDHQPLLLDLYVD